MNDLRQLVCSGPEEQERERSEGNLRSRLHPKVHEVIGREYDRKMKHFGIHDPRMAINHA